MRPPSDTRTSESWYRQPIAWLGIFVFLISMAGCVWIISVSLRYDETPTYGATETLLGVPVAPSNNGAKP